MTSGLQVGISEVVWGHSSKTSGWEDEIVLGHMVDDKIHISSVEYS